jgi:subtilisin family serine protease
MINRRGLAVLLMVLLLVVAVVLVSGEFSGQPAVVDSPFGPIRTLYAGDSNKSRPRFVGGEVLVKFSTRASEGEVAGLRVAQGCEEVYVSPFSGVRRWRVPASKTVLEWVDFLGKHPLVEYAEPNYLAYSYMVPDDPGYGLQWHFDNPVYGGINMEAAWDLETGNPNVVVAVVDSGVAYEDNVAPDYWHIDTYQAYSGHSWWCGVSSAPSSWIDLYGSAAVPGYGNGWKEYLQHSFDLTDATGTVTFSYQYRCHLEEDYDYAFVEVSSDGGEIWAQLVNYTGPSRVQQVNWSLDSVDLSSFKGSEVMVRFRVFSDEIFSDEDYDYYKSLIPPVKGFDSDGAFFVDNILLEDGDGTIFSDDVESGNKGWVTTSYEQAPDLEGTFFWSNGDEIPGNTIDDDGNGFVDDVDGWDFVNGDDHPNDDDGHGTHVSGTIAQTSNNGLGVAGVAHGVTVMPVKVMNSAGTGSYQWIADGIYYAVDNGANIISMSLGGPDPSSTLENAVAYAYNYGVTVFAASGNDGEGSVSYPAAYDDYVIAVGATQYDESRAPYSNYGSSLDIVAPGGNVEVDQNGDSYADGVLQNTFGETPVDWSYWFYDGTSMATPHASGVAALLLSVDSSLSPDQIRDILQSTAEDLGATGRDNYYGYGLIDARAALESVSPPVHLLLTVDPFQGEYVRGEELSLGVSVFNEQSPAFNSTLSLTVSSPEGYYVFDTQNIAVEADSVEEYSFSWIVPDAAGTYVVEVGLIPPTLTAYDAVWLEVN